MTTWKSVVALVVLLAFCAGGYAFWHQQRSEHLKDVRREAIDTARLAMDKGQGSQAYDALKTAADEMGGADQTVLYLQASALESAGRSDEAFRYWEKLDEQYPTHPYTADVVIARAVQADLAKDYVTARQLYSAVLDDHSDSPAAPRAKVGLFELENRLGNDEDARQIGLRLVDDESIDLDLRMRVAKVLGDMNLRALYSRQPSPGDEIYVVQSGDYVQKIASKFNVAQELLLKINDISDPRLLSVGHRLKVPKMEFALEVDKYNNTLTVRANGQFFKRYRCRTGRYDYMTPEGEYKIQNKKKDPEWRKPGSGELVPSGDPANELGTRWMAFQGSSLGIHGTIDPTTIGYYTSQGCVGMLKEDVEELFEYIPLGTPLTIRGSQNPKLQLDEV